jgi:uncharacterized protein (UPF0276 family)
VPDRSAFTRDPIPASAGIGLRGPHYREVADTVPPVGFLEVHSENYFGAGGVPHAYLERIRRDYPLSLHGVGLSLGSVDPLSSAHLHRLKALIDAYQPEFVSEHLSWGSFGGRYVNDLLPLPYTEETVDHLVQRIHEVQDTLERPIIVENVSCYLEFEHSRMSEWEFVTAVAENADCGILLDINNIYVNAHNHGFDATAFIDGIPGSRVGEIHLAGHTVKQHEQGTLIIDTHDHRVCPEVWDLYRLAVERFGAKPTLIEWDSDLPALGTLVDEANIANGIIEEHVRARVA